VGKGKDIGCLISSAEKSVELFHSAVGNERDGEVFARKLVKACRKKGSKILKPDGVELYLSLEVND
jgi:hypothetical protein